jgi:hypothetical protein
MTTHDEAVAVIRGWFTGRLPKGIYAGPLELTVDRDEITVVGPIPEPEVAEDAPEPERAAAVTGCIKEFRERTRLQRMAVAREAEHAFGRAVSWGVLCGAHRHLFTTHSVPVMTRLRQAERQVLDTLVEAGVARSRSEALAWCVRLVGRHAEDWLADLRTALSHVERVRAAGPPGE